MSDYTLKREFMRTFMNLSKQSRFWAVSIVVLYIVQVFAAIVLGYWFLQQAFTWLTGVALAVLVFFIATRLRGFNNIVHECSHYTFTQQREDNTFLGSLCASLILGCFRDYRDEHLTHHAHLGDYDRDMDLHGIQNLHLEAPLTMKTVLRHILTPVLGLHFRYYLSFNLSAKDGKFFQGLKFALVAAAIGFLLVEPVAALVLVWLPFIWVFTALNYWTDCVDHGGLVLAADELEASRNFVVPQPLRAILFPRNDCFHLVHHLFPQVPANHLEDCHAQLLANPEYRGRAEGEHEPAGLTLAGRGQA